MYLNQNVYKMAFKLHFPLGNYNTVINCTDMFDLYIETNLKNNIR